MNMKPSLPFGLSLLLAAGPLLAGEPTATNAPAEKKAEAESRVRHGPNGEIILTLDVATQKRMGLQTAALEPAHLSPELKAYGRVLDFSPLAALTAELTAAQAAGAASRAEFNRLKTLAGQNNASERALQAAEAAAVRDQAQAESARLRLLAGWGSAVAQRPDLPALVQALGSQTSALVELNVPAGQPVAVLPTGARLFTLADQDKPIAAQFLGPAPSVDPQMQGRGFLLLIRTNSPQLAPGAALTGYLALPGEARAGVALPRPAIVRFNTASWIYLQTAEDTFQRTEVKLECPLDGQWFVAEGLKPQQKVVTVGAQQLLSEELKGQAE